MGKYYKDVKHTQIMALLRKLKLELKGGSKHQKAVARSGNGVPVPKKHKNVSKGVVEDICKFLVEEGYDETIIDKYVK